MKSQSITEYIWLGLSWRYLQDVQAGYKIFGKGLTLTNIERVFELLENFGLPVTRGAAVDLEEIYNKLKKESDGYRLTIDDAKTIQNTLRYLQKTLRAEAGQKTIFLITEKKIEIPKLLLDISTLFNSGIFEKLNELSRYDFSEAGKCIAFERSTAAAFHILRGTEGVLKDLYFHNIKKSRLAVPQWGTMTDALRKKRKPLPEVLLNNLDTIRKNFRNPTQHPEKRYEIEECQNLLFQAIDVVNRMVVLIK